MQRIEGLADEMAQERERVLSVVRTAIRESDLTLQQIATFSELSESAIYKFLNGRDVKTDTLVRLAWITGVRIQLTPVAETPSFQLRLLASSRSRSDSSFNRSRTRNLTARSQQKARRTATSQRKRSAAKKDRSSWFKPVAQASENALDPAA